MVVIRTPLFLKCQIIVGNIKLSTSVFSSFTTAHFIHLYINGPTYWKLIYTKNFFYYLGKRQSFKPKYMIIIISIERNHFGWFKVNFF